MEDVLLPSTDREALGVPAPAPPPGADTDQPVIQLPEDQQDTPVPACTTPLEFLETVMNDTRLDVNLRTRAAIAAAGYRHPKRADEGKKKTREKAATEAVEGDRLKPRAPPKLRAVGGK